MKEPEVIFFIVVYSISFAGFSYGVISNLYNSWKRRKRGFPKTRRNYDRIR